MNETNIIFLFNKEENDIYAIFPESQDLSKLGKHEMLDCYASVGQHSRASIQYIRESQAATPEQYQDLKTELEGIGYNLNVLEY